VDLSWTFPFLLFLHVLGAIVAFGPTFTFSFIGAAGGAEPQHANFATRLSHTLSSRLVIPIGFTLPITGLAMIAVRQINPLDRPWWWLALAIVLYLIAYGYGFFVQRKLVERVIEITSAPPPPGASGPPPELMALVARIQRGGMGMGILIVTIVFLMVVKPRI
jgi:drug/metabolite transporter (DMT)-like permease